MPVRRRTVFMRALRRRLQCVIAAGVCAGVLVAASPAWPARASRPPPKTCSDTAGLARESLRLLGDVLLDAPDARLVLEPLPHGAISLRLFRAEALVLERVVSTAGIDCAELPDVIAILVRGGLRQPVHQLAREVIREPAPEPPREPVAAAAALDPPVPAEVPPPRFRAAVHGGAWSSFSRGTAGAPAGIGAAEWHPDPRWGAALLVGVDAAAVFAAGPGELSVSAWHAAVAGRLTLALDDATALDLLAGPSLHLLSARTVGFPVNFSQTRPAPSATGLVRVRHAVARNVEAAAALAVSWRPGRDSYRLEGVDTVGLPPTRVALLVGVVWGFDRRN